MEKILFSNSFNQTEYLRTLAKLGHNTFGLRIMNDVQLCSFVLEHSNSMPDGTFISSKEEDYIYYHLGGGDYNDAKNLRSAIDSYRDCAERDILNSLENNLSNDFLDKKNLIEDKYQQYEQYKKDNKLYDKNDLINFITSSDIKLDIECEYYQEFGITQALLRMLQHVFSEVRAISLSDTFAKKDKEIHFMKTYGKPCEADYIFSEIKKYQTDECQIVLTTSEDALEVVKTAQALNIPYTSRVGSPIIASNAGILLSYLFKLEDMSYGVDGYRYLFNAKVFNSQVFKDMIPPTCRKPDREFNDFIKCAGWLRLSFKNEETIHPELYKKHISSMLLKLQESLAKGKAAFIREYLVSITPLDETVISTIEAVEKASQQFDFKQDEILRDLIQGTTDRKVAKSGHLYITDINSAISSLRKHVFIIGLDSNFPGGPKENYLIFDEEYARTGSDYYDSKEIVRRKERILRAVIDASEDLYLTYPYFELASLEDNNPSSVFFDLYPGDVSKCPSCDYEDLQLSPNKEVYKAHLQNEYVLTDEPSLEIKYDSKVLLAKNYSPSEFHKFFEEENKLAFLLTHVLGIDVQEEDDLYSIISSNDRGTLMHGLMEHFQKDQISLETFKKEAEEAFDKFVLTKPAVIPSSLPKAKADYLRIIENLYNNDPGNEFIAAEEYVAGKVSDINFGGRFDRIEKNSSGKYILVDYKTGRKVNHKDDDVISCIQGLIYGYLINHNDIYKKRGIVIDRIEFRYPDSGDIFHINYTKENQAALIEKVNDFKTAIENNQLFDGLGADPKYIDKFNYLLSLMGRIRQQ